MADKIKLGLVGAGHMGQYHINVAVGLTELYDLRGIYDASPERAKEISERFSVRAYENSETLIQEVDAIVIAVPTVLHYELALVALNQGKHVLVEKPMTESVAQASELVELADKKNLVFQVGHVERFNGAILELGKIVENPFLIETRRLSPFNPRIADVGVVLDLLIHDLDIVLNLVGRKPVSVHGRGMKAFSDREDIASAMIQFEGGCIANLTASRATQSKVRTLTVSQEKAYIMLDFATQDIDVHRQASSAYGMTPDTVRYKQESFVEKIFVHKDNPLKQEHMHFVACIRKEQEPIVTGQSDLQTLEIATDILERIHQNF